ncbi:MAG: uncharacterized protein KVP18_002967 [Porospora cf. gigantea A]|uniref:uncharacterized protein n=1 Tax=Porospora cf. gigantea A TaxID=2853593 RepID=UPI003559E59B|nr:MAG: hypothetical protein KVP18_002967 [Porospora cf. gigantea A]
MNLAALVRDHHSSLATVQFDLKGGLEAEPVIEGELALHDSDRQLICHLGIRFEGWSLDEYVGEFDRRATEIESAAAAATSRGHESDITTALKRVATLRPQLGQAEYPGDAQRIVDALSGFEFLTSRSKTPPSSTKRAKSPPATASSPPTASPPTASPPTASPPIMTPPVPQEPPIRPRGPHSVPREYWLVHHSYEVCRSRWRRLLDDPGLGECLAGDRQALALMDEAEKHWKQVKRTLPVATNFRDTCLGFGDELSLNHSDRRSFIALFYCLVEERVRIQHYAL